MCVCSSSLETSGSWLAGCSSVMFGRVPARHRAWRTGGDVPELRLSVGAEQQTKREREREGVREWRGLSLDRAAIDMLPSPPLPHSTALIQLSASLYYLVGM